MIRVSEIVAYHVRIPLRKPIRHASYARQDSDNLIVSCQLENGITGLGEGVPREYVTGETITDSLAALRQADLRSLVACAVGHDFTEAVRGIEQLTLPSLLNDPRACRGNAARCALELALLDALGRHYLQPLSAATRILAPDLWSPRTRVQYSGAITSASGLKLAAAAWLMRLYGFRQCKVKVGIAGHNDVKRLAAIRGRVGPRMGLRIDANESWPPGEVVARISELEPFRISCVEQPVRHECVESLTEVRARVRTPIMHDESLCSRTDAEKAVSGKTCDFFNIRLSKCGGFIPSLRLAQFARQHGLGYQLGCQVGETALLSAAGRHFACSVGGIRYLEGSYDRWLVREPLGKRDLTFKYGGWAPELAGPGLGVDVDERSLQRVTVTKEVLFD